MRLFGDILPFIGFCTYPAEDFYTVNRGYTEVRGFAVEWLGYGVMLWGVAR